MLVATLRSGTEVESVQTSAKDRFISRRLGLSDEQ